MTKLLSSGLFERLRKQNSVPVKTPMSLLLLEKSNSITLATVKINVLL